MDARKQLEVQSAMHQKTREQLRDAERELSTVREQLCSVEKREVSTLSRGSHKGERNVPLKVFSRTWTFFLYSSS